MQVKFKGNNMTKKKNIILWIIAIVLMLLTATYQRMTGPTYPVTGTVTLGGEEISFKLPRSTNSDGNEFVEIKTNNDNITGEFRYKRYKSYDEWTTVTLSPADGVLRAEIPHQPPAGKVEYRIILTNGSETVPLSDETVVIRFKGVVPLYILIPHILAMFLAMAFSLRALIEIMVKGPATYKIGLYSALLLALGGLILGPIVQKFAFGAFWTGWPFGHDLTDNKTVFSLIIWVIALWRYRKNPKANWWIVVAAMVQLAIYLIPHSAFGSEIDHTKLPQ